MLPSGRSDWKPNLGGLAAGSPGCAWTPPGALLLGCSIVLLFLGGELLLGQLSETVVVVGDAPHDRPGFLASHLIRNSSSFLSTEVPMPWVPDELSRRHS